MKKFKRTILALALVVAMSLTGTACGGGQGGETEALKGVDVENGILYVGNTAGTTGALATIGVPFNYGIQAAFAAYNNEGGYTGKLADGTQATGLQVKLNHYDDGGLAENTVTYTEQLIHDDEVFAIVGNFGSYGVDANLDIIKDAKVPMVYAAAGNETLLNENATGSERYIFPVQPLNVTEGRMLLSRAFAPANRVIDPTGDLTDVNNYEVIGGLGATKVGVISNSNEASRSLTDGIKAEAKELPDAQENAIVYQDVATADFTAAVNALKAAECDTVILTVIGDDYFAALKAIAATNYACTVLTTYNNAAVTGFNDNNELKAEYVGLFSTIKGLYNQGWLDMTDYSYVYNDPTPLNEVYKALSGKGDDYTGTPLFSRAYWDVAEDLYNFGLANFGVNDTYFNNAFLFSFDAYALAGYIAGDLFVKGLKAVEANGLTLTRANYVSAMEKDPIQLAMAGMISFQNGMRSGVSSFALNIVDVSTGQAAAVLVKGLTSISDFRDLIKG